jgi:hypothetical protein
MKQNKKRLLTPLLLLLLLPPPPLMVSEGGSAGVVTRFPLAEIYARVRIDEMNWFVPAVFWRCFVLRSSIRKDRTSSRSYLVHDRFKNDAYELFVCTGLVVFTAFQLQLPGHS